MSVHEPTPFRAAIPSVDADRAVNFGLGVAAAPLWATFFTAAGAGMAYWWMTAWTRREASSFAPATGFRPAAVRTPVPVRAVEPELRPEPVAAPVAAPAAEAARAPEPAKADATPPAPEPAPVVEAHAAPHAPELETTVAATPVAAGLEPAVEPKDIAAALGEAKPVHAAPRGDGVRAEGPAAAQRKPPVRRKPEPKA